MADRLEPWRTENLEIRSPQLRVGAFSIVVFPISA
jgi:hypothetical protein